MAAPKIGSIAWIDLTVPDAENVRNFYQSVVGFNFAATNMGDYEDYTLTTPDEGKAIAGVCHARGMNASLPPQWLPYFMVASVTDSVMAVTASGGEVVSGPMEAGGGSSFCVVKDPAGACCALMGPT
ncbi:MAG TPA: VOC family protein [Capsulimonadaceae bacterium]|jgi:hypothetical protein